MIFEECTIEEIIVDYNSLYTAINSWESRFNRDIRAERLRECDLRCFVPQFDRIRAYCDECEQQELRNLAPDNHTIPDDSMLRADIRKRLDEFMRGLSREDTDDLAIQIQDLGWLSEQSFKLGQRRFDQ